MRHRRWRNVFSLGDAGSSPNSKTGAAIRKQAPVITDNFLVVMTGREPPAVYDRYASCLLAEFDYTMKPHPTTPLIDTQKERYDMGLLKRYGLPSLYRNLTLKGFA